MVSNTTRMRELIDLLKKAAKAYYQDANEIMSNFEYDKLYDELVALEEATGVVMADSPTVSVGYEVLEELPKEAHERPMLSLNKTKSIEELAEFAGEHEALLSWKLDGLTIVLTYQNGILEKAVTRGNGEVGEVITNNAKVFKNVPLSIPFKNELILRGEAVIKYSDFEKINEEIKEIDAKYKNPRNLCSGTVRQLNNEITAKRNVFFYAFSLVKASGTEMNSRKEQLEWLSQLGFDVVAYRCVNQDNMEDAVAAFAKNVSEYDLPSDGLVLVYDNVEYGRSLGRTAKFPRDSIAFKWADETASTHLLEIEWSVSRTGLMNPVAIFEPVELEGTTVSRASVHNLSMVEDLQLGVGDELLVYKANMIIPQIADNLTKSGKIVLPDCCPVCGGQTIIRKTNEIKYLMCANENCQAKQIKAFSLMVSRDALNIEGLSEATLEKFIQCGFIKEYADIYHIKQYEDEITQMEGFGEKSFHNLIASIEKSRETTLAKYLYSLGISNIGLSNAKVLLRHFNGDLQSLLNADKELLSEIDGIGEVIADSFLDYFADEKKRCRAEKLLKELKIKQEEQKNEELGMEGMNFVITGSLNHFQNRNELKAYIEENGGKVVSAVSKNTSYLINNDKNSSSSKNKKAKELSIPILSEEDFLEQFSSDIKN